MQLAGGASSGDCLPFDPFPFDQDGLATSEVDVGGRQIADALVVTSVVVVGDEGLDVGFEIDLDCFVTFRRGEISGSFDARGLRIGQRRDGVAGRPLQRADRFR
jgi:hypothetical protein